MNTSNFPFAWPIPTVFPRFFFAKKKVENLFPPWQVLVMLPVVMRRSGATKAWDPMWPWNHPMGFPPPRSSPGRLDQQLQSAQVKLKPLKTARQDLDFLLEMLCFYMFLFIFSAILDMDWWLYIIYIDFMITALCCGCILVAVRTGAMKDGIRRSDADSWRCWIYIDSGREVASQSSCYHLVLDIMLLTIDYQLWLIINIKLQLHDLCLIYCSFTCYSYFPKTDCRLQNPRKVAEEVEQKIILAEVELDAWLRFC